LDLTRQERNLAPEAQELAGNSTGLTADPGCIADVSNPAGYQTIPVERDLASDRNVGLPKVALSRMAKN
jgi:hypothetical protein